MTNKYPYELPELPYSYEALSPVIGEDTLHFHHDKHMQTYVDNLNKALEPYSSYQGYSLSYLLSNLSSLPEEIQTAVKNNGGGVYNHNLYFSTLTSKDANTKISDSLQKAIQRDFGNVETMLSKLKEAALGRFGSGWAYIVSDEAGVLSISTTGNQDVPDFSKVTPIFTVDVWEHAYYLDYQNLRPDYVDGLLSLINWDEVSKNYENR